MLIAWMGDNSSTDWPVGLKFVQFMKNTRYHSTIKQTPFSALFGGNPRVELRSTNPPIEILERLVTEDDLFAAFNPVSTDIAPAPWWCGVDPSLPGHASKLHRPDSPSISH